MTGTPIDTHHTVRAASRVAVLGLLLLAGCAINPVSGRRELSLVSEADEIAMGREGSAAVASSIGLLPDAATQAWVGSLGLTVASRTERPRLPWEFKVVDDASVNAFALPGGFIFVTRGLLTQLTNEAELVTVLGHESGHVAARHSVQQMSREQLATLGLGIGAAISPAIARFGKTASVGLGLLFLKYSRDDESQADRLGFRYATADGFDAREMISVFRVLEGEAALSGGGRLPEWQSTHPDPGNRITAVQRLVDASPGAFATARVGGAEFLQHLDGMVYGNDPRNGFFQGTLFLHPTLALTLRFPAGWKTRNANDAVSAMSTAADALIELREAEGSAAQAAQRFFAQEGVTAGPRSSGTIDRDPAIRGEFSTVADASGGALRGLAVFIESRGHTWAITAFTPSEKYPSYSAAFERTIASFARLTDPVALAVQPLRVRLAAVPRVMTLEQFNALSPSVIPLAELALINGVESQAPLRAGQTVKRVLGVRPPTTTPAP